ncbi:MAG: hypothetical protein AB1742_07875 [bacterium]
MYRVLLSRSAEKLLTGIQKKNKRLFSGIIRAIGMISENPYCAKPLMGNLTGYYEKAINDYLDYVRNESITPSPFPLRKLMNF